MPSSIWETHVQTYFLIVYTPSSTKPLSALSPPSCCQGVQNHPRESTLQGLYPRPRGEAQGETRRIFSFECRHQCSSINCKEERRQDGYVGTGLLTLQEQARRTIQNSLVTSGRVEYPSMDCVLDLVRARHNVSPSLKEIRAALKSYGLRKH